MKIICFGSLNHDHVYAVARIARPGETTAVMNLTTFCGGKGLNQAVALARAGARPFMAGQVGQDGAPLLAFLREQGADTSLVRVSSVPTGHAVIQVEPSGQNCILVCGGANRSHTRDLADAVLSAAAAGDTLLLQNEVNGLDYILAQAKQRGLFVALNPSPIDENLRRCPLDAVNLFFINEIEGYELTGQTQPEGILNEMQARYPGADVVLTLGKDGVVCRMGGHMYIHGAYRVPVVDTTAAGDTFTGFFLAALTRANTPEECLRIASVAASLAVSRPGAAASIPALHEVQDAQLTPL